MFSGLEVHFGLNHFVSTSLKQSVAEALLEKTITMPLHLYDTGDELSLRHLPDISDASFSFQIPTTLSKGDLLLGDDDKDDFFRNVNDSPATPGPSRGVHTPLTLEEVTPRPKSKPLQPQLNSTIPLPFDLPTKPKSKCTPQGIAKVSKARSTTSRAAPESKPMITTNPIPRHPGEALPVATRLEVLRAEVQRLNNDLPNSSQSVAQDDVHSDHDMAPLEEKSEGKRKLTNPKHERSPVKPKPTVISGGVSKLRSKHTHSTSTFVRNVVAVPRYRSQEPQRRIAQVTPRVSQPEIVEPQSYDEQNPDSSVCSTMSGGGVAERLVMYSQRLMESYGPFSLNADPVPTIVPAPNPEQPPTPNNEAGLSEAVATPDDVPNCSPGHKRDKDTTIFTLSQLSPRKCSSEVEVLPIPLPTPPAMGHVANGDGNALPPSPMRPSRKRPVGDAPSASSSSAGTTSASSSAAPAQKQTQEHAPPKAKKSKLDGKAKARVADTITRETSTVDSQAAGKERIRVLDASSGLGSSSGRSTRTTRSMGKSVSKKKPRGLKATSRVPSGGSILAKPILAKPRQGVALSMNAGSGSGSRSLSGLGDSGSGSGGSASALGSSHADNLRSVAVGMMGSSMELDQQERKVQDAGCSSGASVSASGARADKRAAVNPTKPVEFKFQLDARLEARRAEHEREEKERLLMRVKHQHHAPLPVPDFKALHAQQEAERVLRKENIVPTVPVPIELTTEERAREREKFDERVREKERELEREKEMRRKEREEEEEREVRKMRRKAVPRAHEVPEWYSEAPKRKRIAEDVEGGMDSVRE